METVSMVDRNRLDEIRQIIDRQRAEVSEVRHLAFGTLSMPVCTNEAIDELTETLQWTLDQIEDLVIETEKGISGE